MATPAADAALVGEDWRPSTLEEPGAAEVQARIERAAPVLVDRGALVGRCGLEEAELWELGVERAPAGVLSRGTGVLLRVGILGALLVMAVVLAFAGSSLTDVLASDPGGDLGKPGAVVLMAVIAVYGVWAGQLAWALAGRERARHLARRRVRRSAVAPLRDPNARLTVAVLDGPGVLRVLLLWLRGHPADPLLLEARVVAERRVPRDEALAAEDAVAALSETAMLVSREQVGVSRRRRAPRAAGAAVAPATPLGARVDADWQPDGTTAAGEAELARRLREAEATRWDAEPLAPLVVADVRAVADVAPEVPATPLQPRAGRVPPLARAPILSGVLALGVVTVANDVGPGIGGLLTRACFALFALAIVVVCVGPALRTWPARLQARPLLRRVDEAATGTVGPLEAGLPGGAGHVAVLDARRDGRRVVSLVHVRRALEQREATLEVRTLAEQELEPHDEPRSVVGRFLLVADDQAFTAARGAGSLRGLRRLAQRLGLRAQRGRRGALLREPLLWIGAALPGLLTLTVAGYGVSEVLTGGETREWVAAIVVAAVLGVTSLSVVACCRRWTRVG